MPKAKQRSKTKKSPITNNKSLITKLSWSPKKIFELVFTIPWAQVKKAYDQALKELAGQTTIKGFRQGKAPISLVEKNTDKQKLYQKILNKLLPETYSKAVKQHNLRPIMSPKLTPISIKEGENWQFKAVSCERPEIKLGDYQKELKGALAKEKIWVPDKGKDEEKKDTKQSYDKKIKLVTQTLLTNIKVELPDILINDEINRMLTRLLDQVNSLGMTIEQYLSSKGMTSEQLRADFRQQAEQTLKLEFILQQIVTDRKVKIEKGEIDKMIQATPDEKIRKRLDTPLERAYLASIIAKRKILDYLINL